MKIITNNPWVEEKYKDKYKVDYSEVGYLELLEEVRDGIHLGHKLLSHPLSGSVKPNETPYKSVLVEEVQGDLDVDSLLIIEDAIVMARNLLKNPKLYLEDDQRMDDCRMIDLSLLDSALEKQKGQEKDL